MSQIPLKLFLAQINTSVGDIEGNYQKIIKNCILANAKKCDLAVFPEMTISGYPCFDLWQKDYFVEKCQKSLEKICQETKNLECAFVIGGPCFDTEGKKQVLRNAAFFIFKGEIQKIFFKKSLPNYGVFDEKRYFEPANFISDFEFKGRKISLLICEDIWESRNLFLLAEKKLDLIISINSSPYSKEKPEQRKKITKKISQNLQIPLVYLNQVGGQDSLVFDGGSFVMNADGEVELQMKSFMPEDAILEIKGDGVIKSQKSEDFTKQDFSSLDLDYQAAVLGLSDYVFKNGFSKILLGMSGGIDSALVATIAVDALGSENVALYALPTRFNSDSSLLDAKLCAKNLGIELRLIDIEKSFETMLQTAKLSNESISELACENLQARIRGNLLMTISNSTGALLLSTSNKSELACGYGTLYGDMCGAFNPIKDFYKSEIYKIAAWRNENLCPLSNNLISSPIPQSILLKEPSAELRFNQKDSDSLPPYEILDKILFLIIEEQKSQSEIIELGFDEAMVKKVISLFYSSEYKRNQAVIGVKISKMSFDKDRRYPIANNFKF